MTHVNRTVRDFLNYQEMAKNETDFEFFKNFDQISYWPDWKNTEILYELEKKVMH